jgi:hypothetical protein
MLGTQEGGARCKPRSKEMGINGHPPAEQLDAEDVGKWLAVRMSYPLMSEKEP